jgi:hypothetical protein
VIKLHIRDLNTQRFTVTTGRNRGLEARILSIDKGKRLIGGNNSQKISTTIICAPEQMLAAFGRLLDSIKINVDENHFLN